MLAAIGLLLVAVVVVRGQTNVASTQCVASAAAQGVNPDQITIPALPCALTSNLLILTTINAPNTTTTPTLQPLGQPAQTIVRPDGTNVVAGDLPASYRALLNPTGSKWILLNPATAAGATVGGVPQAILGFNSVGNGQSVGPLANSTAYWNNSAILAAGPLPLTAGGLFGGPSVSAPQWDLNGATYGLKQTVVDPTNWQSGRFGCDGVHDIEMAVVSASVYLTSFYGGGTVELPAGTACVWGATLNLTQNNVNLMGNARGGSVIKPSFTSGDIISVGTSASITRRNTIADLQILCGGAQTAGAAIHVNGADQTVVRDVTIGDPTIGNSGCWDGVTVDSYGNQGATHIDAIAVYDGRDDGVDIGTGGTVPPAEVFISNITVSTVARFGFNIQQTGGVYGSNISVFGSGNVGCRFAPIAGQHIFYVLIDTILCDTSTNDNVYFGGAGLMGNVTLNKPEAGSSTTGNGISFNDSTSMDGITLRDAESNNNLHHGLVVGNPWVADLQILGGRYCQNSITSSGVFNGINIAPTSMSGLQIGDVTAGSCGFLKVNGQANLQGFGINIGSGVTSFNLHDNRTSGNVNTGNITAGINGPSPSTVNQIYSNNF